MLHQSNLVKKKKKKKKKEKEMTVKFLFFPLTIEMYVVIF